jgi:GTP-binding protein
VGTGEVKLLVLLTKADKLSRKEADAAVRAATDALGELSTDDADIGVLLFSALNKSGVDDAASTLRGWVLKPPRTGP